MSPDAPRIDSQALAAVVAATPELGRFEAILCNGLSLNTAACLFRTSLGTFFAKRYDPAKRDREGLEAEHALTLALMAQDYPTPRLYANRDGQTLTWEAGEPYALYAVARGEDRYREASVFGPFRSSSEATSAGGWLARFHLALAELPLPPAKPFLGITARYQWLLAPSSAQGLADLLRAAPLLSAFLEAQSEFSELKAFMEARHARLAPFAKALPVGVIHGDFIKRNLFYEGDEVSDVLDFDLWNVGPWVYDLALALLPCGFDWAAIARGEAPRFADVRAFLHGYQGVRPLSDAEAAALPIVMESARVEYYLSLIVMALQQHDDEKAMLFWGFIVTLVRWFGANVDWSVSLREGGAA
jgi:Ser/Thr protein kinase RdoA (MazF antagonist)